MPKKMLFFAETNAAMKVPISKAQKIKVLNSDGVYKIMQQVLLRENEISRNQEHFWIIGLDKRSKIDFIELLCLGNTNRVSIDPPDVYRMAIYKNSPSVILVHNHPSGKLKPSEPDVEFTDYLYKAAKIIRIDVVDHLIISEVGFYSLLDNGHFEQIKNSGLFEVERYKADELKQLKIEVAEANAAKKAAVTIAENMLKQKFDIEIIVSMTGLDTKEIKQLAKGLK